MRDAAVPVIACRGLSKTYQGPSPVQVLQGVDFEVREREHVAIVGKSGSGKSTLLHLLATLDRPDEGTIFLGDRAIHALDEREATIFRRRHIGIVF